MDDLVQVDKRRHLISRNFFNCLTHIPSTCPGQSPKMYLGEVKSWSEVCVLQLRCMHSNLHFGLGYCKERFRQTFLLFVLFRVFESDKKGTCAFSVTVRNNGRNNQVVTGISLLTEHLCKLGVGSVLKN